jgi:preprotein translocase subunit YajC
MEITGAEIGSYQDNDAPRSYLHYGITENQKTAAEYRKNIKIKDLGAELQKNNCLSYDNENKSVKFDFSSPLKDYSNYDWDANLSGGFLDDSTHKCFLNGCFVLNVKHKGSPFLDTTPYTIYIYSVESCPAGSVFYESTEGSTNVFIPPILIYWGCYAKDTQIRMADGSTKRTEEIRCGDRVSAFGGKTLTVADILTGVDAEICKIETSDGNSIRVSGGHAMKVYDENNPAGKRVTPRHLKNGDILMKPSGTSVITKVSVEPYDDSVYNFIFENEDTPNYIEANGYWSGDFYAQNEEGKNEVRQLSAETQALINEFKELAKR